MSRTFLILHGIYNHRPPEHWQHWLAERLRAHGEQVLYPALPEPDAPRYRDWADTLADLLAGMRGERVVICHSLACLLWLRFAQTLDRDAAVDRLLLVSPPAVDRVPADGASFLPDDDFDPARVRASARTRIQVAAGEGDPYNTARGQGLIALALGARLHTIKRGGHITPDDGYGPWTSCERWCLNGKSELTAEPPAPVGA